MYHCLYIVIVSLVMSTYNINFSAITATTTSSSTTSTMPAMSNRAPSMANRLTLFRQDTLLALFYACCPTAWNTTKWYRTSKSLITAVTFIIIKQRQKWRRPRRQHQYIRHSHVFLSQRGYGVHTLLSTNPYNAAVTHRYRRGWSRGSFVLIHCNLSQ